MKTITSYHPVNPIRKLALGVVAILLIPLIATLTMPDFNWGPMDFVFAAGMLFGFGLAYLWLAGKVRTSGARLGIAAGLIGLFLVIWVDAAVGIF